MKNKEHYNQDQLKLHCGDRKKGLLTYELVYFPLRRDNKNSTKKHIYYINRKPKRLYTFKAADDKEAKIKMNEFMEREYRG